MQALVLAGQPNRGPLKSISDCLWEAEIPLAGRPMLDYVLDALDMAREVDRVVVVGPAGSRPGVRYVPAQDSLWDNVEVGLSHLFDLAGPCLVVTADIPLVTGAMIDEFIHEAPIEADFVYPVVRKETAQARFPGTRRTYVRFREGTFTGGNLFLMRPHRIAAISDKAKTLLSHRKSPRKLAQDIGWGVLWRLITGRLGLSEVEATVSRILGIRGRVIPFDYPEIGVDVDKVEDFQLIEQAVKGVG